MLVSRRYKLLSIPSHLHRASSCCLSFLPSTPPNRLLRSNILHPFSMPGDGARAKLEDANFTAHTMNANSVYGPFCLLIVFPFGWVCTINQFSHLRSRSGGRYSQFEEVERQGKHSPTRLKSVLLGFMSLDL